MKADNRPPVLDPAVLAALAGSGKRSKYNAEPVVWDGERFDSKAEAQRYIVLLSKSLTGAIALPIERQVKYVLQEGFRDNTGKAVRAITWTADFVYTENGQTIAEDVKGTMTQQGRLRHKMFQARYPEIVLRVVQSGGRRGRR